jgi:hypothetical protein
MNSVSKGCFLKFGVKVGAEKSIVNEQPFVLKTLIFQTAD